MQHLLQRVRGFGTPRVALVGDLILDRYVYGHVERINQEAPVPILRTTSRAERVGGAGNVALAVRALGGAVECVGVIGDDPPGRRIEELLAEVGAGVGGLVRLADRPTPVKTRYVGLAQHRHAQQMLRVDDEVAEAFAPDVQERIRQAVRRQLAEAQVLLVEDYDKGVLTDVTAPRIIADARQAGKRVLVDPGTLVTDYRRYRGATLLTPNRYEAAGGSGVAITDDASLAGAAQRLLEVTQAEAIVITLDREGAYLHLRGGSGQRIRHDRPRTVYEVTGAGDEVLAALAVALAEGCEYADAVTLANVAGGLEVERVGMVPVTREEMAEELERMIGLRGRKVLDAAQLARQVEDRRRRGQIVVFTNGCFDLLHVGHVRHLRQARELGSCLVVAINSDASARRLKGPTRPVIAQAERAEMLASLEWVDYVTVFDEDTPEALLRLLRPDVLAKGGATEVIVGREIVAGYGGKVVALPLLDGLSTSRIIGRIVGNGSA